MIVTDPFYTDLLAWARTRFGALEVHLAGPDTFDAWLAQSEGSLTALGSLGVHADAAGTDRATASMLTIEDLNLRQIGADESPAVRFVNSTLYDALSNSPITTVLVPAAAGRHHRLMECVPA